MEHVDAETAERIGLVLKVVDDDDLVDEALALATRLASGPPYAVRTTKRAINRIMQRISQDVMPFSLAIEGLSMATDDHREAVAAFTEKRQPQYTGR